MFGLEELLLLVFAVDQVLSRGTDYCYAYDDKPYLKFGTRTAYHFVHGGRTPYEPIPHCRPVQIWMLIRHGTKYPESDIIERMQTLPKLRDEIIENHEVRGYGRLCNADLDNLRMWRLDPAVTLNSTEVLTEQGVEDLNLLGRRIKSNFPELFPPVISNSSSANYKFRTSNEGPVMTASRAAFMSGAFDRVDIPDAEIPPNDTLFTSYRKCRGWKNEVADNPEIQKEVNSFAVGPEIQDVTTNVSRRLGFLNNMTVDSIVDMWNICRFDKAWNISALSPWCAVFSEEELKVLVYNETLNDYYTRGPSHEFNLRLGCPPKRHLFQHFEKLEGDDYSNEPKGIFNIAGSRSVHLFMAAMGIAKDPTPPLASGFRSMNKRQWSTSEIGPFATNIAAIFYKCDGTGSPNKVMFYLAEKPVPYDGCTEGLCEWEYLKNKFPNATSDYIYSNESKGVFNVVRSGSLHLFTAAMGFAKDSAPPLASEFESMNERKWRTSEIGSFAANVGAVFFKCNDTGSPNKVMFYQSENILSYEGCDDGFCDWKYLENKFPNATADCNYDFCRNHALVPLEKV